MADASHFFSYYEILTYNQFSSYCEKRCNHALLYAGSVRLFERSGLQAKVSKEAGSAAFDGSARRAAIAKLDQAR